MIGVHVLIGVGEAAITASDGGRRRRRPARPGARRARPAAAAPAAGRHLVGPPGRPMTPGPVPARASRRTELTGLVISLVLAGFVSFYALPPRTAWRRSPPTTASTIAPTEHVAAGSPLADYGVKDVDRRRPSPPAWLGVIGVGAPSRRGARLFAGRPGPDMRGGASRPPAVRTAAVTSLGAGGHAHRLYSARALPRAPPAAALQARRHLAVRVRRRRHAAGGVLGVRPARRVLAAVAKLARVPAAGCPPKRLPDRGAVLSRSPCSCRSSARPRASRWTPRPVRSVNGLWGAWNILAKGTLGVAASALLTATTSCANCSSALQRLRLPAVLVPIASFMIRYGDVITDDMRRMRVARVSRGYEARGSGSRGCSPRPPGALFIRSYERGERVYLAMVARG